MMRSKLLCFTCEISLEVRYIELYFLVMEKVEYCQSHFSKRLYKVKKNEKNQLITFLSFTKGWLLTCCNFIYTMITTLIFCPNSGQISATCAILLYFPFLYVCGVLCIYLFFYIINEKFNTNLNQCNIICRKTIEIKGNIYIKTSIQRWAAQCSKHELIC